MIISLSYLSQLFKVTAGFIIMCWIFSIMVSDVLK